MHWWGCDSTIVSILNLSDSYQWCSACLFSPRCFLFGVVLNILSGLEIFQNYLEHFKEGFLKNAWYKYRANEIRFQLHKRYCSSTLFEFDKTFIDTKYSSFEKKVVVHFCFILSLIHIAGNAWLAQRLRQPHSLWIGAFLRWQEFGCWLSIGYSLPLQ